MRMSCAYITTAIAAALMAAATAHAGTAQLSTSTTGSGTTIAGGGAWSWFSDSRAVYDNGHVYASWVTTDGKVQVGDYNVATATSTRSNLFNGSILEADDHDYASLIKNSDGYYTAIYSRHSQNGYYEYYQTATAANSVASWGAVQTIATNTSGTYGTTYANPFKAPWDSTGNTVVDFWRGGTFNPTYSTATYNPATHTYGTWSSAQTLILNPGQRPYVKYATNNTDRIGFIFTDAHPGDPGVTTNNVFYAYIAKDTGGQLSYFKADGTKIQALSAGPITPSQASKIFSDPSPTTTSGNAWVWDMAYTSDGKPVVVYTAPSDATSIPHETYHWAIWNGSAWIDKVLVNDAGGPITRSTNQQYYSGGIALDHENPYNVYISAQSNPAVSTSSFQLTQIKIDPNNPAGAFLFNQVLSTGLTGDCIRPYVPLNHPTDTDMVVFMNGSYLDYANKNSPYYNSGNTQGTGVGFNTTVQIWTSPAAAPVPLPPAFWTAGTLMAGLLTRRAIRRR